MKIKHIHFKTIYILFLGIDSCSCGGLASLKSVKQASRLETQERTGV